MQRGASPPSSYAAAPPLRPALRPRRRARAPRQAPRRRRPRHHASSGRGCRRRGRSRPPSSGDRRRGGARPCRCRLRRCAATKPSAVALTVRTTGATGSESSDGSPPWAEIQRSYSARAEPSCTAASARRVLRLVDAEIGEREQMRARAEDELGEVGRPLAAQRRDRLADLERVADRAARAADPCPSARRRPRARLLARARASSPRARAHPRASS